METSAEDSSTSPSAKKPESLFTRLFINRDFAYLFWGETISQLGDNMFTVTLTLWVALVIGKNQSWAPLAVTGLVLSAMIPPMVIGLFAGVYIDRWNRKVTMVVVDIIQTLLVTILIATTFFPGGHLPVAWQLGIIIVTNFLLVSVDQFFNQAGFSIIRQIVPQEYHPRAISRLLLEYGLGVTIGPAIAAPVFFLLGPRWTLIVNALTFVVSLATTMAVHQPARVASTTAQAEARPGFWSEFVAGVKFIFDSRILRAMLIAMIIEGFGTAALPVLNIFFFVNNLHTSGEFYGFMVMTMGIGVLVGSAICPPLVKRFGESRIFWFSLYGDGILLLVYSRLTIFAPADALIFLLGVMAGLFNVSSGPLVLRLTPDNMMGRTTAVRVSLNSISAALGALVAGLVVSTIFHNLHVAAFGTIFGSADTVFFLAGILALISAVYAMRNMFDDHASSHPASVPEPTVEQSPEAVKVAAE